MLEHDNSAEIYLASMGIGLQNGMASAYSGMLFHGSGIFTDLGIYSGQRLHRLQFDTLRVQVCVLVVTTFTTSMDRRAASR